MGGVQSPRRSSTSDHCVLVVEDDAKAGRGLGPALEAAPRFASGTNVEFRALRGATWRLRVWERGVGGALACGSGAGAAAAVLRAKGRARLPVSLALPGGTLEVHLGESGTLELSGPVVELA
jgi:diaminopimelate epimerase